MPRKKTSRIFKKEKFILRYEMSHLDKVIIAILAIFGSVLIFLGIKNVLEKFHIFQDPVVMLFVGIAVLFLTGSFIKVTHKKE